MLRENSTIFRQFNADSRQKQRQNKAIAHAFKEKGAIEGWNSAFKWKQAETKKEEETKQDKKNTYENERCKKDALAREGKSNKKAEQFLANSI